MSVAEIMPRGEEFERTPPHDLAAEQCVLGGMMLSKDAISDVLDVIKAGDYYRPAHQLVHEVIFDLYSRGEPADAVTVAAELTRSGDIGRVGGAPYLHTLIASVPTAANAGYYARIVRERAILRRLVEVGTRIVQLGYAGDGDADELVDRAQAEVYGVTERRVSEDYLRLSEVMPAALEEIEAISSRGGTLSGVPTGFADLDSITNGLHPGQMVVVAARPAMGKALALDTPLPTPCGWTTMGKVAVGDRLLGADGRPVRVIAATDVLAGRPCYEVVFDDQTSIVADADHQWVVHVAERRPLALVAAGADPSAGPAEYVPLAPAVAASRAVTTGVVASAAGSGAAGSGAVASGTVASGTVASGTATSGAGRMGATRLAAVRSAVVTAVPVPVRSEAHADRASASPAGRRRVAPLRAVSVLTTRQIAEKLRASGGGAVVSVPTAAALDLPRADLPVPPYVFGVCLGEIGTGQIPPQYLRASREQRMALLAGLLDAGGAVTPSGAVQIIPASERLAVDARELVASLGYRGGVSRPGSGRSHLPGPTLRLADPAPVITFTTTDEVFRDPRKRALHGRRRPALAASDPGQRVIVEVREVASVPVRCVQVDAADSLYLASRSMIPTHNSALALDIARAASVKAGLASVLFSLEMSRNEITMRLLSAEARVSLQAMRTGKLEQEDWNRLAMRMSEVVDAPLFIDDSPNMSMPEIRSKCRRLKQRHDLRLVIVDYLQLMSSPKKVENRQQEVSELSRSLKLLAKELNVPVVALAQLNRGPELRSDKRPLLADLRESGCLTADTRIIRADNNAEVSLGELLAAGERDIPVWALDERLKYVRATMSHVFATGRKETFRLRLASGRQVEATGNHRFLTLDGWVPLAELPIGSRIAVPRWTPPPLQQARWPEQRLVLLAHLLGDGSFVRNQPLRYASVDEANLAAVAEAALHFGVIAVRDEYAAARATTLRLPAPFRLARGRRDPIAGWLDELGLFGLRSHERFVPAAIFGLPSDQVALFLRHLWATDGSVTIDRNGRSGRVYFGSTSRRLLDDIASLLRRFGINARIRDVTPRPHRPQFMLDISGRDDQLIFLRDIGAHGARGEVCRRLKETLQGFPSNTSIDTIPSAVWRQVRTALADQKVSHRQFAAPIGTQFCGGTLRKHSPSRGRLAQVAELLNEADLEMLATNDVLWDEIVAVEALGVQDVYDATVLGLHNFIADGVAVHNSIEQDSDVVILLHREDFYEPESPRAGEADLIVAKHRNGPTTTVTVAFQGHYSRFVDMAPIGGISSGP